MRISLVFFLCSFRNSARASNEDKPNKSPAFGPQNHFAFSAGPKKQNSRICRRSCRIKARFLYLHMDQTGLLNSPCLREFTADLREFTRRGGNSRGCAEISSSSSVEHGHIQGKFTAGPGYSERFCSLHCKHRRNGGASGRNKGT